MKLKKLAVMGLTGMIALGTGVNVCAASPITDANGSDSKEVKARYHANAEAETVYSVDVTWGNMEFVYTIDDEGTWDPEKHQFTDASESGKWSCEEKQDEVTVTNHSNAPVNVSFAYQAERDYDKITGNFDKSMATKLETAEGTEVLNAPAVTAKLSLTGTLSKDVKENTKIGTATVSLSEIQ